MFFTYPELGVKGIGVLSLVLFLVCPKARLLLLWTLALLSIEWG